ncbi:hypothetical protein AMJ80_08030 [bacterium SM23_31]|nr:MAG: hypothetical protein AMJ80_08030 [bacterium SM23_31]
MDTSFIHLHCHSNFSLLNGTASIDALLEQAVRFAMPALALTDCNTVSGSVEFYEKARLRGIKPITGAEITMSDGSIVVLLVKNAEGYHNLCRLLTTVNLREGHGRFFCKTGDLIHYKKGLVLLSGGKRGRISQLALQRKTEDAAKLCRLYRETFGKDFYIEMTHYDGDDALLNCRLADLSRVTRVPLVASNDVFLIEPGDQPVRAVLRAIGKLTTVNRLADLGSERQYFMPSEDMKKLFNRYPEAVKNTVIIADKCRFDYSLGRPVFPKLELPEGETGYSMLWKTAFDGLKMRYKPLQNMMINRLKYELDIIHSKGFSEYFLIAKDIVDYCRSRGIPCVGRGSAADSLVSYVLGITQADPIKYDLYFERFLNPERSEPPDIDIDICWKRRDEVLSYLYNKYGSDKTAIICTFNTFQLRSAVGDAGKAFGLPEDEVRRLTKSLPHRSVGYLENAVKNIPECRNHPVTAEMYKKIVDISRRIAGFPRHLSVHPGGVIIAPDDITRYTALEVSGKGLIISQHDMESIEKLGLVKMDVLGVRGLSVIADCANDITSKTENGDLPGRGVRLNAQSKVAGLTYPDCIPENDKDTMQMIMKGETVGCFQIESPAMRGLLKKMQVQSLKDIIDAVAVIRPGPSEGGMKDAFIRRRAGVEKVTYPHPLLEPVLKETYGVVVYQEQVLKIASVIAGFSYGEADVLRRAMTKSRTTETIKPVRDKFIKGAENNGVSEKSAQEIWKFLESFVGYGFNKAHSATYGILAYQSAYLKRHYPVPFMTAVLNNGGGFYSICAYIEEARRMSITIEPPDVNKAEYRFTNCSGTIISGLYPVYGLTRRSIERITSERKREPFHDLFDFLNRSAVNEKEAAGLAKCGALRTLHTSEPEALTLIKVYFRNGRKSHVTRRLTENLSLPPYTLTQRVIAELETLRFAVSAHPLSLFSEIEFDTSIVLSTALEKYKNKDVVVAGWMVTSRRAPTGSGRYIKFATLEDKTGLMEVVLFPDMYEKYGKVFKGYGPFRIRGKVQSRVPGEANVIADSVYKIRPKNLNKSDHKILDKDLEDSMFFDAA